MKHKHKHHKHKHHHHHHCCHPPHCGHHCGHHHHHHCHCHPFCWCEFAEMWEELVDKIWVFIFRILFYSKKKKHPNYLKVAFIGNYKANCGISTYNEDLIAGLLNQADTKQTALLHVFAEYIEGSEEEREPGDEEWVTRCWHRGEHPKIKLIQKIIEWRPDIVHISHEYGIFPQAYYFTSLVSVLKSFGIKVVATMHSVYEHKDKVVSENAPDYLIVHTEEAKQVLVEKGISRNKITVIPHGSPVHEHKLIPPDWNTWNSDHTIFQAGFMFGYKGHARMMKIVARLKDEYPDVHYIIQGSENKRNQAEHDSVYHDLVKLSKQLGIQHHITINRGFVTTDILMSHIRTVKCCVLPYVTHPDHDVRATSGIARLILTTETPLVISDVHLFDDIKHVAAVAHNDDDMYEHIRKVFSAGGLTEFQKKRRLHFLEKTSWETIGEQTIAIYKKINLESDEND